MASARARDMVRFMGRENLEDYNANFFVMFETWEAARKHLTDLASETGSAKPQSVEIATLLGWMRAPFIRKENRETRAHEGEVGDARSGMTPSLASPTIGASHSAMEVEMVEHSP